MKWKLNELKFSWHLVALHLISEEPHGAEYTGLGAGVGSAWSRIHWLRGWGGL